METKTKEMTATELKALIYDQIVILDNYRRAAAEKQQEIATLEQQLQRIVTPNLQAVKSGAQ